MLAAGDGVDEIALGIEYLYLQVSKDMTGSLVVSDGCILGTTRTVEGVITLDPAGKSRDVLNGRGWGEEGGFGGHERGGEGAQG